MPKRKNQSSINSNLLTDDISYVQAYKTLLRELKNICGKGNKPTQENWTTLREKLTTALSSKKENERGKIAEKWQMAFISRDVFDEDEWNYLTYITMSYLDLFKDESDGKKVIGEKYIDEVDNIFKTLRKTILIQHQNKWYANFSSWFIGFLSSANNVNKRIPTWNICLANHFREMYKTTGDLETRTQLINAIKNNATGDDGYTIIIANLTFDSANPQNMPDGNELILPKENPFEHAKAILDAHASISGDEHNNILPNLYKALRDKNKTLNANGLNDVFCKHTDDKTALNCILNYHKHNLTVAIGEALLIADNEYSPYLISAAIKDLSPQKQIEALLNILRVFSGAEIKAINNAITNENCDIDSNLKIYFAAIAEMLYGKQEKFLILDDSNDDMDDDICSDNGDDGEDENDTASEEFSINSIEKPIKALVTDDEVKANELVASNVLLALNLTLQNSSDDKFIAILKSYSDFISSKETAPDLYQLSKEQTQQYQQYTLPDISGLDLHPSIMKYLAGLTIANGTGADALSLIKGFLQIESSLAAYCIQITILEQKKDLSSITKKIRDDESLSLIEKVHFYQLFLPNMHEIDPDTEVLKKEIIAIADMLSAKNKDQKDASYLSLAEPRSRSTSFSSESTGEMSPSSRRSSTSSAESIDDTIAVTITSAITAAIKAYEIDTNFISGMIDNCHKKNPKRTWILYRLLKDSLEDVYVPEKSKIDFNADKNQQRQKLIKLWKLLGEDLFVKHFKKLFNDAEDSNDILEKCIFSLVSHDNSEIKHQDALPAIICASIKSKDNIQAELQDIFNTYYMRGDLNYYTGTAQINRREMFVAAIITAHNSLIDNDKSDDEIAAIYRRGYYKTALLNPEKTCGLINKQKPKDGGLRSSLPSLPMIPSRKSKQNIETPEKTPFAQILDMISTDKQYAITNDNVDKKELEKLFQSLFANNVQENSNAVLQNLTAVADQHIYEVFITAAINGYIDYAKTINDDSGRDDAIKQIYNKFSRNDLLATAIKQSDNHIKIAYLIAAGLDDIAKLYESIKTISQDNETALIDALIEKIEPEDLIKLLLSQKGETDKTLFNAIIQKLAEGLTAETIGNVLTKIQSSDIKGHVLTALLKKTGDAIKTGYTVSLLVSTKNEKTNINIMLKDMFDNTTNWSNTLAAAEKIVDTLDKSKIDNAIEALSVKFKVAPEKEETAIPRLAIYYQLLIKLLTQEATNTKQIETVCLAMYNTQRRMNTENPAIITKQTTTTHLVNQSNAIDHKAVIEIANLFRTMKNSGKLISNLNDSTNTIAKSISSAIKDPKAYINENVITESKKTEYQYYLKIIDQLNTLEHQPPLNADLGLTIKSNEKTDLFSAIATAINNTKIDSKRLKNMAQQENLWFVPRNSDGKISNINGTDRDAQIDIKTALKDNYLAMQALSYSLNRSIIVLVAGDSLPPFEIDLRAKKKNSDQPILLHLDQFGNYQAITTNTKRDIRTHLEFDQKIALRSENTLSEISDNYLKQEQTKKNKIINGAITAFINSSATKKPFTSTITYANTFKTAIEKKIDLNDPTNCYLVLDAIISKYDSENSACYITMITTALNSMIPDTLDRAELLLGILNEKCRYKFDTPLLDAAEKKNIMIANILLDDLVDSLKNVKNVSSSTKWQLLLDSTEKLNISLPSLQFSKEHNALISKTDYWIYYDENHSTIIDAIDKALWSTNSQLEPNVTLQTLNDLSEQLNSNSPQIEIIKGNVAKIENQYGCNIIIWRNIKDKDNNGIEPCYSHNIDSEKPIAHILYDNKKYCTITTDKGQEPLTLASSQENNKVLFTTTMRLTVKDEKDNLCKVETASDGCDFLHAIGAYNIGIVKPNGVTHKPSNQGKIARYINDLHKEGGNSDNINFSSAKPTNTTDIQKILNALCYTLQLNAINIYTKKGLHTVKANNSVANGNTLELLYHNKKYYNISRLTPIGAITNVTKANKQTALLNLISRFRNYLDNLKPLITAYCSETYGAENKVAVIVNTLLSAAKENKLKEKTDALKEITDINQTGFIISALLSATDKTNKDVDNFILNIIEKGNKANPKNYYELFQSICKKDHINTDRFIDILNKYQYARIFNEKDASNLKDITLDSSCNFADHLALYMKATARKTGLSEALSIFSGGEKLFTDSEPKLERVTASWISVLIGSSSDYEKITNALSTLLKQKDVSSNIISDVFYWICKNENIGNDNIAKIAEHIIANLKSLINEEDTNLINGIATRIIAQTIYHTKNNCADAKEAYNTLIGDSLLWKECFNLRKSIIIDSDIDFQKLFKNIWNNIDGNNPKEKRKIICTEVYLTALPLLDDLNTNDETLHKLYAAYNIFIDNNERPDISYNGETFKNIAGMYELALMQHKDPMHMFIFSLKTFQPIQRLLSSFNNSSNSMDKTKTNKLFADAVHAMSFDGKKPSKLLPLDLDKAFRDTLKNNSALKFDPLLNLFTNDETDADEAQTSTTNRSNAIGLPQVSRFTENFRESFTTITSTNFQDPQASITKNLLEPIKLCPAVIFHKEVQEKINSLPKGVKSKLSLINDSKYIKVVLAINYVKSNTPCQHCFFKQCEEQNVINAAPQPPPPIM